MFPLFFGMVMYANEVETKKNIKITWDKKINYNIYIFLFNLNILNMKSIVFVVIETSAWYRVNLRTLNWTDCVFAEQV